MLPGAAFVAALPAEAQERFADRATLDATLATLYEVARAAYPALAIEPERFAGELARRLGAAATPGVLAGIRADHVYLAIACAAADDQAIRAFEAEFHAEIETTGARMRARADQIDEVRSYLRRTLFVNEPGRPAALSEFTGRGDLRSYLRVIATRELVRVISKGRRQVGISDEAMLDLLSPINDPELDYLRERYRSDVDAAMRAALVGLGEEARAYLRYSLIDGWSVDRIGALYGVHRATAARRVAAAREELAVAIRKELATRLQISVDEVDSIVRLVQSRIDLSLQRLLA
jgi:RNA polymerase sigma-70 factor (ECF subfamily)